MAVYLVINQCAGQEIRTPVRNAYPLGSEFWSDSVGFVYTKDTAREVAKNIGVSIYDNGVKTSGHLDTTLVAEITENHFGAGPVATWTWLSAAFREGQEQ